MIILALLCWLVSPVLCYHIAARKGLHVWFWVYIGFVLGLLGVAAVAGMRDESHLKVRVGERL
jgi:hypothetical protein